MVGVLKNSPIDNQEVERISVTSAARVARSYTAQASARGCFSRNVFQPSVCVLLAKDFNTNLAIGFSPAITLWGFAGPGAERRLLLSQSDCKNVDRSPASSCKNDEPLPALGFEKVQHFPNAIRFWRLFILFVFL